VEWDMSCEDAIAELEFESDDSAEEYEMKLSLLEIYNSRLEKRRMIKKYAIFLFVFSIVCLFDLFVCLGWFGWFVWFVCLFVCFFFFL
jgi:hypothetical protein